MLLLLTAHVNCRMLRTSDSKITYCFSVGDEEFRQTRCRLFYLMLRIGFIHFPEGYCFYSVILTYYKDVNAELAEIEFCL